MMTMPSKNAVISVVAVAVMLAAAAAHAQEVPGREGPKGVPGASPAMVVDTFGNVVGQLFAANKVLLRLEGQLIAVTLDRVSFSHSPGINIRLYETADCTGQGYRELSPTAVLREGFFDVNTKLLFYPSGPSELLTMRSANNPHAAWCVFIAQPIPRLVAPDGEFDASGFVGPFSVQ
jgi:hypothetical protein